MFHHLACLSCCNEVADAILLMKNVKAPGLTGITADTFRAMIWRKHDTDDKSANDDAHTGELDIAMWNKGTLSPVPKKGILADPNKWRPKFKFQRMWRCFVCLEIRPTNQ
eukprot:15364360-Ditylum_brightwellii.AAC.1